MTVDDFLKIKKPERLFPHDPEKAKKHFHKLALMWHPDRNKNKRAGEVLAHLSNLYDQAVEKLENGLWEENGRLTLVTKSKVTILLPYQKCKLFELGSMYVSDDCVTYVVDKKYENLVRNFDRTTSSFKFSSDRMKKEVQRYLPRMNECAALADGKFMIQVNKTPDLLILSDVLDHFNGKLNPAHASWMTSTLYNLACYLKYANLTHNDISPDTFFVSAKHHSGALLGGWWYSVETGGRMKQVPKRTFNHLPSLVKSSKKANPQTDLELIRATGREMLAKSLSPPIHLTKWFKGGTSDDALKEYKMWSNVLDGAGKRKYVNLELTADDLYK